MLTGDKRETAVNIAYACKLLEPDDRIFTLKSQSRVSGKLHFSSKFFFSLLKNSVRLYHRAIWKNKMFSAFPTDQRQHDFLEDENTGKLTVCFFAGKIWNPLYVCNICFFIYSPSMMINYFNWIDCLISLCGRLESWHASHVTRDFKWLWVTAY